MICIFIANYVSGTLVISVKEKTSDEKNSSRMQVASSQTLADMILYRLFFFTKYNIYKHC